MHTALILFQKPADTDRQAGDLWLTLQHNLQFLNLPIAGVERPSEGCWLIELATAWTTFSHLIAEAGKWKVPYRVTFFAEPPVWLGTWKPAETP